MSTGWNSPLEWSHLQITINVLCDKLLMHPRKYVGQRNLNRSSLCAIFSEFQSCSYRKTNQKLQLAWSTQGPMLCCSCSRVLALLSVVNVPIFSGWVYNLEFTNLHHNLGLGDFLWKGVGSADILSPYICPDILSHAKSRIRGEGKISFSPQNKFRSCEQKAVGPHSLFYK